MAPGRAAADKLAALIRARTGLEVQVNEIKAEVQNNEQAPLSQGTILWNVSTLEDLETAYRENYDALIVISDEEDVEALGQHSVRFGKEVFSIKESLNSLRILEDPDPEPLETPSDNEMASLKRKFKLVKERIQNVEPETLTQMRLKVYEQSIDSLIQSNEELFDRFNLLNDIALVEQFNNEYKGFFDDLVDTKEFLQSLLKIEPVVLNPSTQNLGNHLMEIRLPQMDIPKFGGNVQQWESFHDLFHSLVVNRTQLSDAQKLQYLKSALIGDAAKLIQSLAIINENFEKAWNIIKNRYENKREIVSSHFKRLMNQSSATKESHFEIRRLLDTTNECIGAIDARKELKDKWDYMLVFMLSQKLDPDTRKYWELSLGSNEIPTFAQFKLFLEKQARSLVAAAGPKDSKNVQQSVNNNNNKNDKNKASVNVSQSRNACVKCNGEHALFKCQEFLKLTPHERFQFVKDNSCCTICLQVGHSANKCEKDWVCRKCDKDSKNNKHNTLLHFGKRTTDNQGEGDKKSVLVLTKKRPTQVLLATAVVNVKDIDNQWQKCRILLDQGAETNLITENCMSRLGLPREKTHVEISGVGNSLANTAKGEVEFKLSSLSSAYSCTVNALIIGKITGLIPRHPCMDHNWPHIANLQLADPRFFEPSKIDILLGAECVPFLFNGGKVEGPVGTPVAQNTKLGWVLSGPVDYAEKRVQVHVNTVDVDASLRAFWEIEEVSSPNNTSSHTCDENECEKHFESTYQRDETGRFIVELPFRDETVQLGESRLMAMRRWNAVEKRILKDPSLYSQYQKCLQEYLDLGHMELVPENELNDKNCYYIPHHAVIKQSSNTTKCRVVFDASAKTTNGLSLNDVLLIGPKLQDDLATLLMRFGIHAEPMVADIAKMYRQFLVHPKHRNFQRIVWKPTEQSPLQVYRLKTVTFGVSSAPYLAIKCVQKLAELTQKQYPLAAPVILKDLYVDNLLTGAENLEQGLLLQKEVLDLMTDGGMVMREWSAHNPLLLESLTEELRETQIPFEFDKDQSIKTLGIQWNPIRDEYSFKVNVDNSDIILTKRVLLSNIAKLFDPLGWLAPVNILAKILLQDTWRTNLKWDDPLPPEIQNQWNLYKQELPLIKSIVIPRCITSPDSMYYELHGFSDASDKAYSAVVYLLQVNKTSENKVCLIAAKTRVAPVKDMTIPRKELCGAKLLSELLKSVKNALPLNIQAVHAYTDSMIVLCWLNSNAGRWKIFVSNRVKQIQEEIPSSDWHHVVGKQNPADVASRGILPSQLMTHPLWWHGPSWLSEKSFVPPTFANGSDDNAVVLQEQRVNVLINRAKSIQKWEKEEERRAGVSIFSRYSSLTKLVRIVALLRRFAHNCKRGYRITGKISTIEYQSAFDKLIMVVQQSAFEEEINSLRFGGVVNPHSNIACLRPFVQSGILRAGGRLKNAKIPENQKFPILMPKHHLFTDLLISDAHLSNLHAGPQLMMAVLQQKYWIMGMRDLVRHYVRACVTCRRVSATVGQQMMADLPESRVTPELPFARCGIDYAGPIQLLTQKSKNSKLRKGYIVLFVCFVTRAVHLELASDLSTSAFLAAFQRFIARRGKPIHVYSDNACNFVRAEKEMRVILERIAENETDSELADFCSKNQINWHFNPPSAPHFGGLWESGVKSVKYHLKRVIKDTKLTFEEMDTLLKNIEAGLNSRPLTPLPGDPQDLQVLTPGHFLIGRPMNALPQVDLTVRPVTALTRWQFVTNLFQHFWKRWTAEYLGNFLQRAKWFTPQREFKVDDIVLIKRDNLLPVKWPLARIITVHPGKDGLVRVVTVQTANGTYTRPISKIALLPISNSTD